ncbi:MAG: hypothetical protein AAGA84_01645 [Pseudomonadota bacterium]
MARRSMTVFIVATLCVIGGCASSQEIQEAHRASQEPPQTGSLLPASGDRESPRDVEVITENDIRESGALDLADAIRRNSTAVR